MSQDRCMIYKTNVTQPCVSCGKPVLFCAANRDLNRETCCGEGCSHD